MAGAAYVLLILRLLFIIYPPVVIKTWSFFACILKCFRPSLKAVELNALDLVAESYDSVLMSTFVLKVSAAFPSFCWTRNTNSVHFLQPDVTGSGCCCIVILCTPRGILKSRVILLGLLK